MGNGGAGRPKEGRKEGRRISACLAWQAIETQIYYLEKSEGKKSMPQRRQVRWGTKFKLAIPTRNASEHGQVATVTILLPL